MIEATKQFQPELFRSYLRVLARVALRSRGALQNKMDASDLVQSALLQAVEDSYCETLGDSARRLEQIPADLTTPSQHVMQNEKTRCLAECLAALPPDQQMAVELHHLAGYSLSEIAQRMKKSKASVAGLLRRGLQNLRESLKEKEHILR